VRVTLWELCGAMAIFNEDVKFFLPNNVIHVCSIVYEQSLELSLVKVEFHE
jgi:hypothetical protein